MPIDASKYTPGAERQATRIKDAKEAASDQEDEPGFIDHRPVSIIQGTQGCDDP
jgi:hypothetical protein